MQEVPLLPAAQVVPLGPSDVDDPLLPGLGCLAQVGGRMCVCGGAEESDLCSL